MNVLQIDDSSITRDFYAEMLASRGHSLSSANNGKEGLEMVLKKKYDLILLDMCMPKYSGMDFLADLKNQRPSELRKVIVVCRLELDENQLDDLSKFGVRSVLGKPSDLASFDITEKFLK